MGELPNRCGSIQLIQPVVGIAGTHLLGGVVPWVCCGLGELMHLAGAGMRAGAYFHRSILSWQYASVLFDLVLAVTILAAPFCIVSDRISR